MNSNPDYDAAADYFEKIGVWVCSPHRAQQQGKPDEVRSLFWVPARLL